MGEISNNCTYTIKQIAEALGVSRQAVQKRAKNESWIYTEEKSAGGKCRRLYMLAILPTEIQSALLKKFSEHFEVATNDKPVSTASFTYDRESLWASYDSKTTKQKDTAKNKLTAINAALVMVKNGVKRSQAFNQAALTAGFNRSSLYRWYKDCKQYEKSDWLAALVPHHAGNKKTSACTPEAWQFFKVDFLRQEQPSGGACYDRLKRAAKEHGWEIPCQRTLERRIESEVPFTVRILMREGEHALMSLYPAQQRTVKDLHALEWINGDGYQHNVFVLWPNGEIARPKTWFWQDIQSRKHLAWRTDQTEHTDVIRLSFGDLVEKYGIPDHATIDNTRAAANKWMTGGVPNRYRFKVKDDDPLGLFPMLNVDVHWTSVYKGKGHGQAKPIERSFGVGGIGEVVDKHPAFAGAFTGNSPMAKPENYGSKAIPLAQFLEILDQEVNAWNAREGRKTEMAYGKLSFDQVFNESYKNATIRKATTEQRRLWLLSAEGVKVKKDGTFLLEAGSGVGIGKNRYYSESLYDHVGTKIVARFDPDSLHDEVHVYTLDGRYITEAECIEVTGFGDTQAAREFNRARKHFVRSSKEAAKAEDKMDLIEATELLPTTTSPQTPNAGAVQIMRHENYRPHLLQPRELTDKEKQHQQQIAKEIQEASIVNIHKKETDKERYSRWARIERQIENGEPVNIEIKQKLEQYMLGNEYKTMKDMFEDFGLSIDDYAREN